MSGQPVGAPRRGQPAQPQAGPRRARVRRLRRRRRRRRVRRRSSRRGPALPDVILMDLQLPGIDGHAALEPAARPTRDRRTSRSSRSPPSRCRPDRDRALVVGLRRLPREADQRARRSPRRCAVTCRAETRTRDATVTPTTPRRASSSSTTSSRTASSCTPSSTPHGFIVRLGGVGRGGARRCSRERAVDVVLLDVLMPGMDGYETCAPDPARTPATAMLPVVMVTASGDAENGCGRSRSGADDFVTKPLRPGRAPGAGALAGAGQAATTTPWSSRPPRSSAGTPSWRRGSRRRWPTSSGWAGCAGSSPRRSPGSSSSPGDESFLESHRRDITTVFTDLRGFTAFAETAEPEETMAVLRDYHARPRRARLRLRGDARALRRRRAHGLLQRPAAVPGRARPGGADGASRCGTASTSWRRRWRRQGHDLGFGVGIAQGYATLGRVGFEGRCDYAAIGTVTNLAARLCAAPQRRPDPRQPSACVPASTSASRRARSGRWSCAGISRPVEVHEVIGTVDQEDDP